MNVYFPKLLAKSFFVFIILAFFVQINFAFVANAQNAVGKVVPKIDDEAAYAEKGDGNLKVENRNNVVYSQNFWVFLFGVYVFLLIFNLSFDFEKKKKLQWFWEAALTFLAIFVWDNLDAGRTNNWFPGIVLESGIIIYGFYLYFHSKMLKLPD